MGLKTPLYEKHREAGGRLVDFGGWDMPLHYGSQLDEHHAVRTSAGMFDVSHMTVVDVQGGGARRFLRFLLANDVARLADKGKALYSCMLNDAGGVIDDLICYYLDEGSYRVVVNAATREKDLRWINQQAADFDVTVTERDELAMIALQGPDARKLAAELVDEQWREQAMAMKPFTGMSADSLFIARTGYTGEDGFEIVMPAADAERFWQRCHDAGFMACGLGARDTLRLEAGMNLYGTDMDEETSPLEAGLGWTLAMDPQDREFVGRRALAEIAKGSEQRRFVGLVLNGKGVLRNHMRVVVDGKPDGEITSGGFSPTMQRSIAMARLPAGNDKEAQVEIRGRLHDVTIVSLPFVRHGKVKVKLDS